MTTFDLLSLLAPTAFFFIGYCVGRIDGKSNAIVRKWTAKE